MRYLSLFPFPSDPSDELVIDLNKPCKDDVQYAIDLLRHSVGHAYQSNFKSLLKAKFPRATDNVDSRKSRLIKQEFAPKRLHADEAITLLEGLLCRGKDKTKRQVHPNSLCNLRPATRFTPQNRPTKPCLMSDQQVQKARGWENYRDGVKTYINKLLHDDTGTPKAKKSDFVGCKYRKVPITK